MFRNYSDENITDHMAPTYALHMHSWVEITLCVFGKFIFTQKVIFISFADLF